jgi:prevent-host-death family protein
MEVGIRELKAKLSAYLDEVEEKRQPIVITDRGRRKAMIVPLKENAIERGIREGWLTPGRGYLTDDPPPRPSGYESLPGVRLQDLIDEDRNGR